MQVALGSLGPLTRARPYCLLASHRRPRHKCNASSVLALGFKGCCCPASSDDTWGLAGHVGRREGSGRTERVRGHASFVCGGPSRRVPAAGRVGHLRALVPVRCPCPTGHRQTPQIECNIGTRAARKQHGRATRWPSARPPHTAQGPQTGPAPARRSHKCPCLLTSYACPCRRARSSLAGPEAHTWRVGGHGDMFAGSAFR